MLLSSLIPIKRAFYRNPYFAEDVTRINIKIAPEKSIPAEDWNALSQDERDRRIEKGNAYTSLEFFVCENNGLFPECELTIRNHEIYNPPYVIDLRRTFFVKCNKIQKDQKNIPIGVKLLELSV